MQEQTTEPRSTSSGDTAISPGIGLNNRERKLISFIVTGQPDSLRVNDIRPTDEEKATFTSWVLDGTLDPLHQRAIISRIATNVYRFGPDGVLDQLNATIKPDSPERTILTDIIDFLIAGKAPADAAPSSDLEKLTLLCESYPTSPDFDHVASVFVAASDDDAYVTIADELANHIYGAQKSYGDALISMCDRITISSSQNHDS